MRESFFVLQAAIFSLGRLPFSLQPRTRSINRSRLPKETPCHVALQRSFTTSLVVSNDSMENVGSIQGKPSGYTIWERYLPNLRTETLVFKITLSLERPPVVSIYSSRFYRGNSKVLKLYNRAKGLPVLSNDCKVLKDSLIHFQLRQNIPKTLAFRRGVIQSIANHWTSMLWTKWQPPILSLFSTITLPQSLRWYSFDTIQATNLKGDIALCTR